MVTRYSDGEIPGKASVTPADLAGALNQLYRANGPNGPPRRFFVNLETLRAFAGRSHLRPEFVNKVGHELAWCGILMSWPRSGDGTNIGFVSEEIVERWRAVSDAAFQSALNYNLGDGDRVHAIRIRLRKLYELNHGDPTRKTPVVLSKRQLCTIAGMRNFSTAQFSKILQHPRTTDAAGRIVAFARAGRHHQVVAITREDDITKWSRRTGSDWQLARQRYELEEIDEDHPITTENAARGVLST